MDGDHIMAACGLFLKEKGKLKNNTIVGTVMSNLGFVQFMEEHQLNFIAAPVGDRYVLEEMQKGDYILGGEQSGHVLFLDHGTTGNGILTALQLVNVMLHTERPISEINAMVKVYPQVLVNAMVKEENKKNYMMDEEISKSIKEIEDYFQGKGRVLIRPSGTEPFIRVMIEGEKEEILEKKAKNLAAMIEKRLG